MAVSKCELSLTKSDLRDNNKQMVILLFWNVMVRDLFVCLYLYILFVFQWGEWSRKDCGGQIYHELHLQSVRWRVQSTGESGCFRLHDGFFLESNTWSKVMLHTFPPIKYTCINMLDLVLGWVLKLFPF